MFGAILMWILSWLTATPVRVVRAALNRVEQGDFDTNLVVFDGTELGQLQRGFNSMVAGLRERERVRDLFGRHVGREVAAAAERDRPKLGGEERHVAVIFVDIIGSTQLVSARPATEVVDTAEPLLRRDRRRGGPPPRVGEQVRGRCRLWRCSARRSISIIPRTRRWPPRARWPSASARRCPECEAGIGVAAGQAVAGNVGAQERFEYTVIGEPVNEACRLCDLAKERPSRLLASSDTGQCH